MKIHLLRIYLKNQSLIPTELQFFQLTIRYSNHENIVVTVIVNSYIRRFFMFIGILKEVKIGEYRVILTPAETKELVLMGHKVMVERDAGLLAGFDDDYYTKAGAEIVIDKKIIFEKSDMVLKVKEFVSEEYSYFRENQILFSCLHPAANRHEVDALLESKAIGITAEDSHRNGSPNAEAAGKLGALLGAYHMLRLSGGRGQTIFGIGGAPAAKVLVLGAGIVGKGAADVLSSMGAFVYVADINIGTLRDIQYSLSKNVTTLISSRGNIEELLPEVDLVLNCVKWPKHRKDHLINIEDLKLMKKGSVIVDISADLDGAVESYRPTSHMEPTYIVNNVVHYGVDNIPGIAPYTVSKAYAASLFPHISSIANLGLKEAMRKDGYLRRSLTVYKGILTHEETSVIQNRSFTPPRVVLGYNDTDKLDESPKATTTVVAKES